MAAFAAIPTSTRLSSITMPIVARALRGTTPVVAVRSMHLWKWQEKKPPVEVTPLPVDLAREIQMSKPLPMLEIFRGKPLDGRTLEVLDIGLNRHRVPVTLTDKFAYRLVKFLRLIPDTYFRGNHYMRAVMLETIAGVPGMVGAMLRHLRSLRKCQHDGGWIIHLLHEAENERMHLMTWMKCLKPSTANRLLILGAQGIFFNAYFALYCISPQMAHRMCGYLEEEAVISYTHFLDALDQGKLENMPAPSIAKEYWNLVPSATIRDVVLAIRADEALHRDANHHLSDRLLIGKEDLREEAEEALRQTPEDLAYQGKEAHAHEAGVASHSLRSQ
ncbi:hypothetical protein BZG36_00926 [Bifiguratus adelaidae]|uniref:Alternative oxidase n=1 Tax=Bifiguratus adelaidae TaxID=1938954 RepID=A0A261Y5K4_9FUNG|nr:hypothetical protein BZG36_00926 [Bifiguratus adelaidae]